MDDNKNLAQKVISRRKQLHLSQKKLAQKIGVSQVTIWKIENALTKHPRKIIELAKVLGVDPEWLLTEDTTPKPKLYFKIKTNNY